MTKCPYCAGEIQDGAIKCKHCKEWIQEEQKEQKVYLKDKSTIQKDIKNTAETHGWWIDLLLFFLFCGFCILFVSFSNHLSSDAAKILFGASVVAYIFSHIKIKKYIIEKLSNR